MLFFPLTLLGWVGLEPRASPLRSGAPLAQDAGGFRLYVANVPSRGLELLLD